MTCYIVAFEVANETNKANLKERLKAYGTYCPINANCWAIVTNQTAAQVRDNLMAVIPVTDKIFVIKSGVEAAWRNVYGQKNSDWLKEKLLLSLAFSSILTLTTATVKEPILETVYIVVAVVGVLLGAYLLFSWWKTQTSIKNIVATIRNRIPPDVLRAETESAQAKATTISTNDQTPAG